MIIILPEPARNFELNTTFMEYFLDHPEMHLYPNSANVNFCVAGSFPQVSYSGEVNNTDGLMFHADYMTLFQKYHQVHMAVIIDCSSHFINELNDYDVMGNALLTIGNTYGDTGIKVSTNYAYDYFHSKYPNCRMIAAAHYEDDPGDRVFFIKEMWPDIQNTRAHSPRKALRINCVCDGCSLEQRMQCQQKENLDATMFSRETMYTSCQFLTTGIHQVEPNQNQMPQKVEEGYKYFILPNYFMYPMLQAHEYVKNLIKPEYHQEVMNYLMLTIKRR